MQKSMLFSQPQISDFYFSLYRDFEKIQRNAAQLECLLHCSHGMQPTGTKRQISIISFPKAFPPSPLFIVFGLLMFQIRLLALCSQFVLQECNRYIVFSQTLDYLQ